MERGPGRSNRLGIAGLGLIGTSVALRAAELGWHVCGWDVSREHLDLARERGAIAEVRPSLCALVRDAETLVLAGPPDAIVHQLEALAGEPPRASLVIDVASVKVPAARAGKPLAAFVGTHPIAGSERSGPGAATARLFENHVWTYDSDALPASIAAARAFICDMGAHPVAVGNQEHDAIVALTSHLPQLAAVALGTQLEARLGDDTVLALCGSGVRSMVRLGASSWPIWRAILSSNGPAVAQEVRALAAILGRVADAVEAGHFEELASDFDASARTVDRLARNGTALDGVYAATTIVPDATTKVPER